MAETKLDIQNLDQLKSIGAAEDGTQPYDVIPLPSKGMFYKNKKASLKVGYLTASDENILLSPNLLKSGKTIEVLLKKKILDTDINPNDLLSGDRDAVLVFLRTSGYGSIYKVNLTDPKTGDEFEYDVDLGELNYKPLVEANQDGEYSVQLPISKSNIKFRLLTIGDINEIDETEEKKKRIVKNHQDETSTKRLERIIMEIDGDRDKGRISQTISRMRIGDSAFIRKYYNKVEPGIDLSLEVQAPSGEFFRANIPITVSFFWPDLE